MTRDEIRLELIKLAHSHGRSGAEAVTRAKVYEAYVVDEISKELSPEKVETKSKSSRKNVGQPNILD